MHRVRTMQKSHFDCCVMHRFSTKMNYWLQKQAYGNIKVDFTYARNHEEMRRIARSYEQYCGKWIKKESFLNMVMKLKYKVAVVSEKLKRRGVVTWVIIGMLPYRLTAEGAEMFMPLVKGGRQGMGLGTYMITGLR